MRSDQEHSAVSERPWTTAHGVLAVNGYGVRVSVQGGHLLVQDGIANERRTLRISRVDTHLRRILVMGHAGTISLDALKWLHDVGIAYASIDVDGSVLAVGAPRALDDVRVLRGQALAPLTGVGLTVARTFLTAKLDGQARIADRMQAADAVATLRDALALLPAANTVEELRFIEARGAAAYWDAWIGTPVHFVPKDRARVPAHWLAYDGRRSVLSRTPRKATNPINALLNYLYAVLEAEASIALRSVGLDPRLGVLHVDSNRRESCACDLMEAVRPQVDAYVRELVARRTFERTEFFEVHDGCCRLMPSIAVPLAATAPRWAKLLGPFAERAAEQFARGEQLAALSLPTRPSGAASVAFRTPLTQANRARRHDRRSGQVGGRCRGCGIDLGSLERSTCDACRASSVRAAAEQARTVLVARRDAGHDARSARSTRETHRAAATRNNDAIAAWTVAHGETADTARYQREIAPLLREIATRQLVEATGLSTIYCRQIKAQKRVPHPRHWDALATLGETYGVTVPAHWDTAYYLATIAPGLASVSVKTIAAATGLSLSYCKRIRRGTQLPKRAHWVPLMKIAARG